MDAFEAIACFILVCIGIAAIFDTEGPSLATWLWGGIV
jgi:hypothetical protein